MITELTQDWRNKPLVGHKQNLVHTRTQEKGTMTNLDSLLKSRHITLPTKIHIVKATAFPVVMHSCECWTIKKVDSQRIDAFEMRCWRRLLRVP